MFDSIELSRIRNGLFHWEKIVSWQIGRNSGPTRSLTWGRRDEADQKRRSFKRPRLAKNEPDLSRQWNMICFIT
jgi:hypothetical protein